MGLAQSQTHVDGRLIIDFWLENKKKWLINFILKNLRRVTQNGYGMIITDFVAANFLNMDSISAYICLFQKPE